MASESKLEAAVVKYAREKGCYTRKFSSPAHRGVPDRIIAANGKILFLELKAHGQRPTALQVRELLELRSHGFTATWTSELGIAKELIDQLLQ